MIVDRDHNRAMIDSRALLMFVTLADEAHFGRTAEALGIAQSVLSLTIKRLEDRLGAPLFDDAARGARSGSRVQGRSSFPARARHSRLWSRLNSSVA